MATQALPTKAPITRSSSVPVGGGAPWAPRVRIASGTVYITPGAGRVRPLAASPATSEVTGIGVEVARTGGLFYLEAVGEVTSDSLDVTSLEVKQAAGGSLPTDYGSSTAPKSYCPLFSVAAGGEVTMHRATDIELEVQVGWGASAAFIRFGFLAR
jgi:hypothetical protein